MIAIHSRRRFLRPGDLEWVRACALTAHCRRLDAGQFNPRAAIEAMRFGPN